MSRHFYIQLLVIWESRPSEEGTIDLQILEKDYYTKILDKCAIFKAHICICSGWKIAFLVLGQFSSNFTT